VVVRVEKSMVVVVRPVFKGLLRLRDCLSSSRGWIDEVIDNCQLSM